MQNDLDRFDFTEDKIFGEPDEHGLSTVTKLSVKRASVGNDGKHRNYANLANPFEAGSVERACGYAEHFPLDQIARQEK